MDKQRTKPLTYKENKLIKGIASGKTRRQAALDAYDTTSPETASAIASETLAKPNVQEALAKAFEDNGITLNAAIAPIGKALIATKVVIHGNKDEAFAEVVEDVDLQLKGSDRALRLMGIGQTNDGVTNNFLVITDTQKDLYGI